MEKNQLRHALGDSCKMLLTFCFMVHVTASKHTYRTVHILENDVGPTCLVFIMQPRLNEIT